MEKQYGAQEVETRIQQWWESQQTYRTNTSAPVLYAIDTPPPTVSGALHIGHIFSYTQTDIIARFQRLDGQEVLYPFGFDDNGLPTERFVEKQRGISAHSIGRAAFIQACLEETHAVEQQFKTLWERMGLSVDWRLAYSTIDTMARQLSQESFIRLYERGFVYRKEEPALYCTACRTTVAQAEIDDLEEASMFHDIVFIDEATGSEYIVATTRPELLFGAVALFYHPSDGRYSHLQGARVTVPIFGHTVPVYADEAVIPTKGTGLVVCCTFGDTLDIAWYKRHNLPYRAVIGGDGRWLPETGPLAGLKVKAAREVVLNLLRDGCLLKGSRTITHVVQVHERCKTAIEFLVLSQWFLRIIPYKKELIALANEIHWYPAYMKARYINWVENITWDWCLSRQRTYGIPFPVWHCADCHAVILPPLDQLPIDPQEQGWGMPCTQCGSREVGPDTDVMDTWNTSSLTPFLCEVLRTGDVKAVFEQPWTPMALRPQAHDIIRTWAFYTIVKCWMHHRTVPWHSIVISGHVLSSSQEKISKSKGNSVMDPHALLEKYPADVVRYWTASATLGQDVSFSEQQFTQGSRLLVKLWNAFRFIAEHTVGAQLLREDHLPEATVHRWILHRLTEVYERYRTELQQYEYAAALDGVERFFWNDLCDNYLELVKDHCLHSEHYAPGDVAETKVVLFAVGLRVLQLFAPYLPHITEELFQKLYREVTGRRESASLHVIPFAEIQGVAIDPISVQVMDRVLHVVGIVRRLKTGQKLSLKQELAELLISVTSEEVGRQLHGQEQLIGGAVRALKVRVVHGQDGDDALESVGGVWHARVHLALVRTSLV